MIPILIFLSFYFAFAEYCKRKVDKIPDINLVKVAEGFKKPVYILGRNKKLFVVEQGGTVKVLHKGKVKLWLDLSKRVESGGEKGLLGLAFHPFYEKNGKIYVYYTTRIRGDLYTVLSEIKMPERRERILLKIKQPFSNHNGGQIAFGPDGYLYIGVGDGGSANDPFNHAQNLRSLLGKVLRIDVDRKEKGKEYAIPPDNPFISRGEARPEIWAYGLRNPWRFSFDPLTGKLYLADVGQNAREEVNIIRRGGNYGWRVMEGSICTPGVKDPCDPSLYEKPIWEYGRKEGIAIIGGYVYRGEKFPELCGVYIFGDWGSGKIWGLIYEDGRVKSHKLLADTDLLISSFGIDEEGNIYVVDLRGGIYKITVR